MTRLEAADEAWSEGRLVEARSLYAAIEDSFHAALQLAWIDGSFGRCDAARVAALRRTDLTESHARLLAILAACVEGDPNTLEGGPESWDIEALRARDLGDASFSWFGTGERALKAGQYGLANACFEEDERRSPQIYAYDPPRQSIDAHVMLDGHLRALR